MGDQTTTTDLHAEVAALREECTALRRELLELENRFGLFSPKPDWPEDKLLNFDQVECIGFRHEAREQQLPLVIRAHEDSAEITFWDEKPCGRARLGVSKDGPLLEFRNAQGNVIVALGEAPDGSGMIYVADAAGHIRSGLRVSEGNGLVTVVDEKGKALAAMTEGQDGGHMFVATNRQKSAVTIKATERGGTVSVHEAGGQLMGFLTASPETGAVSVYGPQGAMAVSLGGGDDGGAVVFYDVEGKITTSLP